MRLFIASDIHGSAPACKKILERMEVEKPDKLVLLGDLLYHGPRNDLPEGYAPKEVIAMLNQAREKIICVRGNCEAVVDQMVLDFPVMADYIWMMDQGHQLFFTHGDVYNAHNMPALQAGDALIHGHTHVHTVQFIREVVYLNPGSVSLPKENQVPSYMMYEDGFFSIRDMQGNPLMEYAFGQYVPEGQYASLKQVISALRAEGGCPWDRAQTHESLKKYMQEEMQEALEGIDLYLKTGDAANMVEELGDVLLQIFLQAQIGEEEGLFTMEDVMKGLQEKMIRRHPHVFGEKKANTEEEALALWQEAKNKEKNN